MVINSILNNQYNGIFNNYCKNDKSATNSNNDTSTRKLNYQQRVNDAQNKSIVEQSLAYANQLANTRAKSKDELIAKKKCQYSFKKLSSQIIRSKTSINARKAISAAKREIRRLKKLKGNEDYDQEEIQLAIDHAKAMEKVARKKVKHLEIEEMIERSGNGLVIDVEELEKKEKSDEEIPEEELSDELTEEELIQEQQLQEQYPEENIEFEEIDYEALMESIESVELETLAQESAEQLEEMMSEFSEEMADMLEELDLTDLAETMYAPDPNMSEDDLKMLKIKHRYKELKAIAEADKEYLKGIMENEKNKSDSGVSMSSGNSNPVAVSSDAPAIMPKTAMPGAAGATMTAPTISSGFDVSV